MASSSDQYASLLHAPRLREETGDLKYYAPLDRREGSLAFAILISCYKPFRKLSYLEDQFTDPNEFQELLLFDRMALLLDIW